MHHNLEKLFVNSFLEERERECVCVREREREREVWVGGVDISGTINSPTKSCGDLV